MIFVSRTTIALAALAAASSASAELASLPTPAEQGGMIHAMVTFLDQPTDSFSVHLEPGAPVLRPITLWEPGETFNPAAPWYSLLDPTQGGQPFNSRYGLMLDAGGSDLPPVGKSLGVRVQSIDPGLGGYLYSTSGDGQFDPVLATAGAAVLWSGVMWHPVFVADAPGNYSVTLEFFVADEAFSGYVASTSATPDPGYGVGTVTLNLSAVPEPSACAWALGGVALAWAAGRRRR